MLLYERCPFFLFFFTSVPAPTRRPTRAPRAPAHPVNASMPASQVVRQLNAAQPNRTDRSLALELDHGFDAWKRIKGGKRGGKEKEKGKKIGSWAQHSDSKHQSAPDKHGHQVEHIERYVQGGIELRNTVKSTQK